MSIIKTFAFAAFMFTLFFAPVLDAIAYVRDNRAGGNPVVDLVAVPLESGNGTITGVVVRDVFGFELVYNLLPYQHDALKRRDESAEPAISTVYVTSCPVASWVTPSVFSSIGSSTPVTTPVTSASSTCTESVTSSSAVPSTYPTGFTSVTLNVSSTVTPATSTPATSTVTSTSTSSSSSEASSYTVTSLASSTAVSTSNSLVPTATPTQKGHATHAYAIGMTFCLVVTGTLLLNAFLG